MRDYELTVLVTPTVSEKDLDKVVKGLADVLAQLGAKINKKADAARRALAYEIAGVTEAYYAFWEVALEPAKLAELDTKLKLEEKVIRYLIVTKE